MLKQQRQARQQTDGLEAALCTMLEWSSGVKGTIQRRRTLSTEDDRTGQTAIHGKK
jgi:hypothetical protein